MEDGPPGRAGPLAFHADVFDFNRFLYTDPVSGRPPGSGMEKKPTSPRTLHNFNLSPVQAGLLLNTGT